MAFTETKHCDTCCTVRQHTNGKCNDCHTREERAAMAAWVSMKKSERLLDLHKRLLRLEKGPPTY